MPFYWATADSAGAKITASETLLSPSPTRVEYPVDIAGTIAETAGGVAIIQQPTKDPRRRAWVWQNYPGWWQQTQDLWDQLYPLRSKTRAASGQGSPYIYLKETETGLLRRQVQVAGTATGGGTSTMTDSGASFPSYAGYWLEIVSGTGAGQRRKIASNTGTVITVTVAWTTQPVNGSKYSITGFVDGFFKVRVTNVARKLRDDGGLVRYDEIRIEWHIEDAAWNGTG